MPRPVLSGMLGAGLLMAGDAVAWVARLLGAGLLSLFGARCSGPLGLRSCSAGALPGLAVALAVIVGVAVVGAAWR